MARFLFLGLAWAIVGASTAPFTWAAEKPVSRGNAFNPDTSANLLGLYQRSNRGNDPLSAVPNGLSLQEVEVQFTADVDPYFRAVSLLSVRQEEPGGEFGIDPEEVYFETITLPVVTLRGGKFKAAVGRHNLLHLHAFPFIDAPLANQTLLGDEGLNDVGVSASALLGMPWFSEITLQAFGGKSEELFKSASPNDLAGIAHLKNLWDLSDSTTLEFGISGGGGGNQFESKSYLYGSDLTLKWRPVEGGKYQSLSWSTEYLGANRLGNPDGENLGGLATWLQYQFAERWWIQGRFDYLGLPKLEGTEATRKESVLLGFFPSEFSGFRVQYDHLTDGSDSAENRIALQWNISIGAHPAHAY